jgi:hypothetical protein
MTPPCLNCHALPETAPDLSQDPAFSRDPIVRHLNPGPHPLPVCTAEPQWPDWLRRDFTAMQNQTWWVRSNFEGARRAKATEDGVAISPIRLNVSAAKLEASLKLATGEHSIFKWKGYDIVDLMLSSGASVNGGLQIKDNAIVLRSPANSQGYPESLDILNFSGIKIDGPSTFNLWPHRVTVGDWGELHFILQPTNAYRFLLDPYMVPRPPLGHDYPTDQQIDAKGQEWITTPAEYPNPKNNPETDIVLTQLIPAALLEPDGRLPENYNLEVLITRLIDFLGKRPKPTEPSKITLADALEYLEPDSKIEIKLDSIKDLLLPGVLDLAESNAKVEVRLTSEKLIELKVPELNLFLDPMDYPAKPDETRPPWVHLLEGSIQAAPSFVTKDGRTIEPGIHAFYDPVSGVAELSANLHVNANLEVPVLGKVDLNVHALIETQFLKTETGFKLYPKTTTIELTGLNLTRPSAKDPKILETVADLNISITDDERNIPDVTRWEFESPDSALATFKVSGTVGDGNWLDLDGHIPLPKGEDGSYDFSRILQNLPLQATAFLSHGSSSYQTKLSLSSLDPWTYKLDPVKEKTFVLDFDIEHSGPDPKDKSKTPAFRTQPFIKGGQFYVRKSEIEPGHNQWTFALSAKTVKLEDLFRDLGFKPDLLKGFGIYNGLERLQFNNIDTEVQLDYATHIDGVTQVVIPVCRVGLQGGPDSLLRGALKIEQVSSDKQSLDIRWDNRKKSLGIKGLDLALSVQQLDLLPPPIKRLLNKRIASFGLDGHLTADFGMNFPEDPKKWNGLGKILLRGDPAGDLYFLDAGGHQVGPAFIRDTRWEFRRINRLNLDRQYALGDFSLDIILNMGALLPSIPAPDPAAIPVYGAHGQRLDPFEINGVMPYDNMPWSGGGFRNRIVDYVLTLCHQDAECSKSMTQGGSNGGKDDAK